MRVVPQRLHLRCGEPHRPQRRLGAATPACAYSYAPGNKRVWRGVLETGYTQTVDEVTFWSVNGQKLTTYISASISIRATITQPQLVATATGTNYYFGGKLIKNTGGYVTPDRLGSIGKYFPYGQERPSATTDGKEKFATYFRDSETGLDYADQRYHQPGMGRFMTPDPYKASGGPSDPGSWNRYAYTEVIRSIELIQPGCSTAPTPTLHHRLGVCQPGRIYKL